MKLSFFLIPKREVIFLSEHATIRQALEKMEHHQYTAIPLLGEDGRYKGTLTEGDLLWALHQCIGADIKKLEHMSIADIPKKMKPQVLHIDEEIEGLFEIMLCQNFVPVMDDREIFIGIIRRREIIEYFSKNYRLKKLTEDRLCKI